MKTYQKIVAFLGLIGIVIFSCKKHTGIAVSNSQSNRLKFTSKMAGKWIFKGTKNYECWSCSPTLDSTIILSDTIIISVIDSATITFTIPGNNTVTLYFASSTDTLLTFLNPSNSFNYNANLTYYYLRDSIAYGSRSATSGDATTINLSTF